MPEYLIRFFVLLIFVLQHWQFFLYLSLLLLLLIIFHAFVFYRFSVWLTCIQQLAKYLCLSFCLLEKERNTFLLEKKQQKKDFLNLANSASSALNLGKSVLGILHDIRHPLSLLYLLLEDLQLKAGKQLEVKEFYPQAIAVCERILELTEFAPTTNKPDSPEDVFYMNEQIQKIIHLLRPRYIHENIQILFSAPENYLLCAFQLEFERIIANLLLNAIEAYPKMKKENPYQFRNENCRFIFIKVRRNKHYVCVYVKDQGFGISEEDQRKIFQPLFTTKKNTENLGLGLTISNQLSQRFYKKAITVDSRVHEGSTFTFRIKNRFVKGAKNLLPEKKKLT